jgi:hypothetical protein
MTGATDPRISARGCVRLASAGISLRQIATSTKISIGVLEALERNDWHTG